VLPKGPWLIDYSRNGAYQLAAGKQGSVQLLNLKASNSSNAMFSTFDLDDTIRDIKILHNESLLAVAQSKALYIYDKQGTEVHFLKTHIEP
jgi:U3 small nucleolar RNA-associated protein 7